jgi:hypothetical protein
MAKSDYLKEMQRRIDQDYENALAAAKTECETSVQRAREDEKQAILRARQAISQAKAKVKEAPDRGERSIRQRELSDITREQEKLAAEATQSSRQAINQALEAEKRAKEEAKKAREEARRQAEQAAKDGKALPIEVKATSQQASPEAAVKDIPVMEGSSYAVGAGSEAMTIEDRMAERKPKPPAKKADGHWGMVKLLVNDQSDGTCSRDLENLLRQQDGLRVVMIGGEGSDLQFLLSVSEPLGLSDWLTSLAFVQNVQSKNDVIKLTLKV